MIPVIIVSHKRANNVLTTKAIDKCILCVPESQADDYRQNNPGVEILAHPDDVIGLSPKRQWILEKMGDCFQVDDDVLFVKRVYVKDYKKHPLRLTPEEAYNLIQDEYEIVKQTKAKLFGFNRMANPLGYSGGEPVMMNKYICGGGLGIIADGNLFFPDFPYFVGEDYWINALNAYYNRYSYIDARFAFEFQETEARAGGCSDYRTEERRKETYFFLKQKFGDAIKLKKTTTIKKTINKWEKTLNIPY